MSQFVYIDAMFCKSNPIPGSNSLICEVDGLKLLHKYKSIHGFCIPNIISAEPEQIKLEKLDSVAPTPLHMKMFAEKLANLHRVTTTEFGYSQNNYIGLNLQFNQWSKNWGEFFVSFRLQAQIKLIQNEQLKKNFTNLLNDKKTTLIDFLNSHRPKASLLHGDLWRGNVLFIEQNVALIDPAVYYGDCEADLAMTKLFGGFSEVFYIEYSRISPRPAGADKRAVVYNLYHYLNHFNLFGDSYLPQCHTGFKLIESL